MLEKRHAAERHKRLGNAASHRRYSAPVARCENQALVYEIHGLGMTSAETVALSEELGAFGA